MERLNLKRLISALFEPSAPELDEFQARVQEGEVPELLVGGKRPQIIDDYGKTLRIRIPWADSGLEKSYIAKVDEETGGVALELEGFFISDKRDWGK